MFQNVYCRPSNANFYSVHLKTMFVNVYRLCKNLITVSQVHVTNVTDDKIIIAKLRQETAFLIL